jgi:hypothetical protein
MVTTNIARYFGKSIRILWFLGISGGAVHDDDSLAHGMVYVEYENGHSHLPPHTNVETTPVMEAYIYIYNHFVISK